MTIEQAIRNSFSFPINGDLVETIAIERGLTPGEVFDREVSLSKEFRLTKADIICRTLLAPNVSEGGVSISWSDRRLFLGMANAVYSEYGEPLVQELTPTVETLDW